MSNSIRSYNSRKGRYPQTNSPRTSKQGSFEEVSAFLANPEAIPSRNVDQKMKRQGLSQEIYRIAPKHYLHVLNQNTNVTRVICGPQTFICQDHEVVTRQVQKMITIPPRKYMIIENPVRREDVKAASDPASLRGDVMFDEHGQAVIRHGEKEVRLAQEPFPLYPGEVPGKMKKVKTVYKNKALRLRALQDMVDNNGVERKAGEQWLFEGPGTYTPQVFAVIDSEQSAEVIKENTALKLRATRDTIDRNGTERVAGEEWLVEKVGAYLPGVYENVVNTLKAAVLTDRKAIHVKALTTFVDRFSIERKCGQRWLVTNSHSPSFIPSVNEQVVSVVNIQTLTSRQYCVMVDPYDEKTGTNLRGQRKLIRGESSFFLHPNEKLQTGIENVKVLQEEDGLILRCLNDFEDHSGDVVFYRKTGERWLIRGPMEYVPPIDVYIEKTVQAIPLDQNEGVYVQNVKTGKIRAVIGETYMMNEDECLWEKILPPLVEALLNRSSDFGKIPTDLLEEQSSKPRDRTRVVTYRVPHNTAVQIYDFAEETGRVVFGPEMVLLGPEEEFTPLSLSGGVPKKPNQVKTLHLLLGPDFFNDEIVVETADHARLRLTLSYNWHFEPDKENESKIFAVTDFVGTACKAVASRVRGAVARETFDDFHKNSSQLIRASVFGREHAQEGGRFLFKANNLVITGIDIKSVDPVDEKTKEQLAKSVQIAIEITTSAQQAHAKQAAEKIAQDARGLLQRQTLTDAAESEKVKKVLISMQAETRAVETTGVARAEAQSLAEKSMIEAEADVQQAELETEAMQIEATSEHARLTAERELEIEYLTQKYELVATKKEVEADIETRKFTQMVKTIGKETIKAIAIAGPEMQAKLLQGLGIESTLIMDGNSPINLFTTAQGMVAQKAMA